MAETFSRAGRGLAAALTLLAASVAIAPAAGADEPPPSPVAEDGKVRAMGLQDLRRVESALASRPDSLDLLLDRVRILYVLSVREEGLMAEGHGALRDLSSRGRLSPGDPLLQAYRGAFQVLGAKHAAWPPRKMEHLKAGLPALDSAVAARPDAAEIRYLRLVSCYYLPFFIGRKDGVRDDFAALARLLPAAHGMYPSRWYLGFARFVLENGKLAPAQRDAVAEGMRLAAARGEEP